MTGYEIKEIPSDMGGRGFEVKKLADGFVYNVHIAPDWCECMGYLKVGRCKHMDAVRRVAYFGE